MITVAKCFDPIGSSSGHHYEPINYKAAYAVGSKHVATLIIINQFFLRKILLLIVPSENTPGWLPQKKKETNLAVEICMSVLCDIIRINILDVSVDCVYGIHYQDERVNEDEIKRSCYIYRWKRMHTEFGQRSWRNENVRQTQTQRKG